MARPGLDRLLGEASGRKGGRAIGCNLDLVVMPKNQVRVAVACKAYDSQTHGETNRQGAIARRDDGLAEEQGY